MPPPPLATPRLLLMPLTLEDAPAIQRVFPQWPIVRYLNAVVPWPYPADGARRFLEDVALAQSEAGRAWHWTLRLRTQPETLIGSVSLHDQPDDHRGFWLDPNLWGQGLMSEACAAVTAFWFNALGRPELRVPKAVPNEASRRLSQREGMRVVARGESDYVSGRFPSEVWGIDRDAWLARHPEAADGIVPYWAPK